MLIEDVVDLKSRRDEKHAREQGQQERYAADRIDAFVDELKEMGVDEAAAEKMVGARLSDLVMAFDLRHS